VLNYPEDAALPQRWEVGYKTRYGESSLWLDLSLEDPGWSETLLELLGGLVPRY